MFLNRHVHHMNYMTYSSLCLLASNPFSSAPSGQALHCTGLTQTPCGSYLRQSQVTSRCDSVILKMLWMALAARICLMVSEMMSADSAARTSMEPRKRTMNSWWRMESGWQREKWQKGWKLRLKQLLFIYFTKIWGSSELILESFQKSSVLTLSLCMILIRT